VSVGETGAAIYFCISLSLSPFRSFSHSHHRLTTRTRTLPPSPHTHTHTHAAYFAIMETASPPPAAASPSPQSALLAPITWRSAREACITALEQLRTRRLLVTNRHGLEDERFSALWCLEKIDVRGKRELATGRAARPQINIRDLPETTREKEEKKKKREEEKSAKEKRGKKRLRESKEEEEEEEEEDDDDDSSRKGRRKPGQPPVSCTRYLATQVVLHAAGRPVPPAPKKRRKSGDDDDDATTTTPPPEGYHASHLCHNGRCLRDSHIRVEPAALNQQRKGCVGQLVCMACHSRWQLCEHKPVACLRLTPFVCNACCPPSPPPPPPPLPPPPPPRRRRRTTTAAATARRSLARWSLTARTLTACRRAPRSFATAAAHSHRRRRRFFFFSSFFPHRRSWQCVGHARLPCVVPPDDHPKAVPRTSTTGSLPLPTDGA